MRRREGGREGEHSAVSDVGIESEGGLRARFVIRDHGRCCHLVSLGSHALFAIIRDSRF